MDAETITFPDADPGGMDTRLPRVDLVGSRIDLMSLSFTVENQAELNVHRSVFDQGSS